MKKLVALVLALGMIAACIPALAIESDDVFGKFDSDNAGSWSPPYDHTQWKKIAGFELKQKATVTAILYDDDGSYFNTLIDNQELSAGYIEVDWPAVNTEGWHPAKGESRSFLLKLSAEIDGETVEYEYTPFPGASFHFGHSIEDHYVEDINWYRHNTVCVGGLEFRQEKPEVTNKWYNFAPIDLSIDGEQVFELVASNMFVIGSVVVTVDGDNVTVEWLLNKQGTTDANFLNEAEFLTFFHSIDEVVSAEPDEIETSYEFGQPISIANDLNGDTNVLLYIRNVATYCTNLSYQYQWPVFHPAFDRNVPFRRSYQDAMRALMELD